MATSYRVNLQHMAFNVYKGDIILCQMMENGYINYSMLLQNQCVDEIKKLPSVVSHNVDYPLGLRGYYAPLNTEFIDKYIPEHKSLILANVKEPEPFNSITIFYSF